jgi:hypothetical protein
VCVFGGGGVGGGGVHVTNVYFSTPLSNYQS